MLFVMVGASLTLQKYSVYGRFEGIYLIILDTKQNEKFTSISTPTLDEHAVKILKTGEQQEDHQKCGFIKLDVRQTFPYLLS